MQIKLYYTDSENNQLSKSLSLTNTLTGTFRNESGMIHPEILVEIESVGTANYAYISEFHRYYYIRDVKSIRNNLWLLYLDVDPLMSFKTDILQMKVVLVESESTGVDNYLADDRVWIAKVKDKTDIITFPNGLSADGDYILITAGGVAV